MATILLVDDDEIFCDLLQGLLSSHKHQVFAAYNGRDGLNLFRQHHPKIAVLDLRMPEMDGLEVLRQIHAIDPQASVMMLTAWGTDELEQQARQYGALDFLSKQLTYDAIVAVVENVAKEPGKLFESGSVLLVVDEDETRQRLQPFLHDHGVAIRAARDSNEALAMISAALPQLIVLDMDLVKVDDPWQGVQKMTAPEFLQALRQIHYPGRLILMSNVVDHAVEAQAAKLQAVDHLQKPVTPDRLLVAIQIALPAMEKPPPRGGS